MWPANLRRIFALEHHRILVHVQDFIDVLLDGAEARLHIAEILFLKRVGISQRQVSIELVLVIGPGGFEPSHSFVFARLGDILFFGGQLRFEAGHVLFRLVERHFGLAAGQEHGATVDPLDGFVHPLRRQHAAIVLA